MITLRLMLRLLARDGRAGELTVLGLALFVAVAALTSVGFLSDRIQQAVSREARQLLGGDLVLAADHPLAADIRAEAARLGLALAETSSFPSMASMASKDGATHLAEVKAVTPGYPLRGRLRTAPALNVPDAETRDVPAPGEAWLDERLASALGAQVGERIRLGSTELSVSAILTLEPDRGVNFFGVAPRLMMNAADLSSTRLIQVGSRVGYRLHLAGPAQAVEGFRAWVEPRLGRGERLESLDNARPEIRGALDQAGKFLRLAALLAVILAAVAVGLASRRYMERHLDGCAVMRCLGASSMRLVALYGGEFLLLGMGAALAGSAAGYGLQFVLAAQVANLFASPLPPPSWLPLGQGLLVALVLLAGFAFPPLLRLKVVPAVRVLRREWAGWSGAAPLAWWSHLLGAAALSGLMLWMAADIRLGLIVLGAFAAALVLYAALARGLLAAAGRLPFSGSGMRQGIAALRQRRGAATLQAVALGLGFTALLLLTLARSDLLSTWRKSVPPDAPNRFIVNVQPGQGPGVERFFAERGLPHPRLEPMVRGRLVAVNGRPVGPADYAEDRAQRLVEREFNLSYRHDLPEGNAVSSGRWFGPDAAPQFSVERKLAETLGLALGDELTYEVAGQRLSAPVTSLRNLDWDSMRVNFFVISPPSLLQGQPASLITSFHLPPGRADFINGLVERFPNVTVVDVESIVRQLHAVMDQLAVAVQWVFGFSLLAGVVVMVAALQSTYGERRREAALLRTLGARNRQLRAAAATEFVLLGAVAGLLGGAGAAAIGWLLARFVFRLDYLPDATLPLAGLALGALCVGAAGMLGTAKVRRRPAMESLRSEE